MNVRRLRYLHTLPALGELLWRLLGMGHEGTSLYLPNATGACERHLAALKARQELGL